MEHYERVLISPEIAREMLKKNHINRGLKKQTIKQYQMDIEKGLWKKNHDPIAISSDGYLENGQHRLHAIIRADKPVEMLVLYDADPSMDTYDRGLPRSITDTLNIKFMESGTPRQYVSTKVAIIRFLLLRGFGIHKPSDEILKQFIEAYDENLQVACKVSSLKDSGYRRAVTRKAPIQVALFCSLVAGEEYGSLYDFCEVANTGFPKEQWMTSPILLRNKVTYTMAKGNTVREELEGFAEMAIYDFCHRVERKREYTVKLAKLPYLHKTLKDITERNLI